MPTNVLLVRWVGGWTEVSDTDAIASQGRREGFFSAGAAQSYDEAIAVAKATLTDFQHVREGVSVETEGVTPYISYEVGDVITTPDSNFVPRSSRVTSISMVEDDDGHVQWTPEVGDLLGGESDMFEDLLQVMRTPRKNGA